MTHRSTPTTTPEPERLGRYRILGEIGRGAVGRVLLAHDPQIDRRVAIKTVPSFAGLPVAQREEARARFLREARAVGRLAHPGIVTLYDVAEIDGQLFLVMEYVEGVTLDAFCRPEALLPVAGATRLVAHAAEALAYAHCLGVVHRDVKPANLIRVGESAIKIADFGLAKRPDAQLTHDGALYGTPAYMSPEQIRGAVVDGQSDLFSLAAVLFELLTGRRAFPGESVSSIIYRIVHDAPPDPVPLRGELPPGLSRFLVRALAKDPAERFADGEAFAAALRQALVERPAPAAAEVVLPKLPPPAPPAWTPRRRSVVPWIVGAALVVGAGAVLAPGLLRRADAPRAAVAPPAAAAPVVREVLVRTEPPGVAVELDGRPARLDPAGRLRFGQAGGLLSARAGCRRAEHALSASDHGGEVVLVLDPLELEWTADPGIDGAALRLNGAAVGATPTRLVLDLCRENRVELEAAGFQPAAETLPAGVAPLEARRRLGGMALEPLPKGMLELPQLKPEVRWTVDGAAVGRGTRQLELSAGPHEVEARNDDHWIVARGRVEIPADATIAAAIDLPALGTLVVQAFPANCKVYLRDEGGAWRYLDDTPAQRRVAAGTYDVKVELITTGETRVVQARVRPGDNPPVRVSFGNKGRS